jgi:serine/threonine-protein kinase RsbW
MNFSDWIKSQLDALRAMVAPDGATGAGGAGASIAEDRAADKLGFKFTSNPANVSAVRKSIEEFCATAGRLDVPACEEIGLVVNEALANVIRHAYGGKHDKPIDVTVEHRAGGVTIRIRDWGNGEDPSKVQREHDPMSPGGIGLVCMKRLMDGVAYIPQPDGMLLEMSRSTNGSKAAAGDGDGHDYHNKGAPTVKSS